MTVSLAFTEADVKLAAGAKSFERGLDYLHHIEDVEIAGAEITASVRGSRRYRVCLRPGDAGLRGECTCPRGREGFFCKHCAAVALAVLKMEKELPELIEKARADWRTLESWLESLSKQELLAELLRLLDEDRELRRRLELRAATLTADATRVRRAVMELVMVPRGDDIQARDYADDVHKAAAAIDDLIRAGGAEDAIRLAEEAVGLLPGAYRSVDDSSGSVGDAEHALLAVHLRACQAAPPDPVFLGEYLAGLLVDERYRSVRRPARRPGPRGGVHVHRRRLRGESGELAGQVPDGSGGQGRGRRRCPHRGLRRRS
jgi:SWIM zinc finger